MCGKFRAKRSWEGATDLKDLAERVERAGDDPFTYRAQNAQTDAAAYRVKTPEDSVAYRVMNNPPVIVWDKATGKRRVVPMRWGFPDPKDWRRPQPIHARSETIEITRAFADAFRDGQRGIVLMENFNEAADGEGPTVQHTITPGAGAPLAAAMVWRRFDVGAAAPLLACCLVTVAANPLIATLPAGRMPAFLAQEDWRVWLGEEEATVDEIKACLKTTAGGQWTMTQEERKRGARRKPIVSDPGGLF